VLGHAVENSRFGAYLVTIRENEVAATSLGLSHLLVEELFALIKDINSQGIALLLIEQNVVQSLEVSQRAYVLENGQFVLQAPSTEIGDHSDLKRTYLGL
jgi:branched-chain amino acid transport system ATP-binding protein